MESDPRLDMSLDDIVQTRQQESGDAPGGGGGGGYGGYRGGRGGRRGGFRGGRRGGRGGGGGGGARGGQPTELTNRIYVSNLEWGTSWQDLKDHFRTCGQVVYADVFQDDSGRSKGCGIVEFTTRDESLQAIRTLNEKPVGNGSRPIFIREDREDRALKGGRFGGSGGGGRGGGGGGGRGGRGGGFGGGAPPPSGESVKGRQLFVGNLAYSVTWQDLKDFFRQAGEVVRADVHQTYDGRSKGMGVVLFETEDGAQSAIDTLNDVDLQGRPVLVHFDKFAQ